MELMLWRGGDGGHVVSPQMNDRTDDASGQRALLDCILNKKCAMDFFLCFYESQLVIGYLLHCPVS